MGRARLKDEDMYLEHYKLQQLPFRNTPDPRFFFDTPRHREALANLIYAVEQRRGFVLLSGEIGSGKTLVTHLLLQHLEDHAQVALIRNTHLNTTQLIRLICDEFSVQVHAQADKAAMLLALNQFLIQQLAEDRLVVVIIDEAQNLSDKVLEELRMLSNLETSSDKLLQIVLVGQPELRDKVAQPHLEQLRQRVALSYHLEPLTLEEIERYIEHRLRVAGPEQRARFTPEAIARIARFSRGTPRIINGLCDNALLYGFTSQTHQIDEALIERVLRQSMHLAPRQHTPIRSPQGRYGSAEIQTWPSRTIRGQRPNPAEHGPQSQTLELATKSEVQDARQPDVDTAGIPLDGTEQARRNPAENGNGSGRAESSDGENPDKKKESLAVPPIIPFPAMREGWEHPETVARQ